jgi:hypothetical protein
LFQCGPRDGNLLRLDDLCDVEVGGLVTCRTVARVVSVRFLDESAVRRGERTMRVAVGRRFDALVRVARCEPPVLTVWVVLGEVVTLTVRALERLRRLVLLVVDDEVYRVVRLPRVRVEPTRRLREVADEPLVKR